MNTIKDLLMSNGYPMAWVQGHHTRITMNDEGQYKVLRREYINDISSSYIVIIYEGVHEGLAVSNFIESENG